VAEDARSRHALAPYTAYVLIYDLPWIYRLWQLNSHGAADESRRHVRRRDNSRQ
jgi:hypothetical protein